MSNDQVISDLQLSASVELAVINAPLDAIDIPDWLLHLPDAEYQRCAPPDHKACGATTTDDGRPMSINVEEIAGGLIIQHYVAEVQEPHHCRMVSLSDVQTPGGWSKVQVVWDLSVVEQPDGTCLYTNDIGSRPTQGFLDMLAEQGLDFAEVAAKRQVGVVAHNQLETPLYAASMERKALAARSA
ncbi:hypothetical protein SAMN05446589_9471 [Streptomyces sp. OV198]|jgi:hypothetical protein|uniref:hypothetical protein n=1 Tax=Streptomyces sp. OV198 TaxID=1882787 RepID=UPI000BC688BB|nr:hypothetical protein [Streptomyces sp. OV198]SOF02334.1 hypothetical protein SAMN05446589_9471 [Streptomyces sp. OV198]